MKSFYFAAVAKSYVNVLLNPKADFIEVFDNITYNSQINLSRTEYCLHYLN